MGWKGLGQLTCGGGYLGFVCGFTVLALPFACGFCRVVGGVDTGNIFEYPFHIGLLTLENKHTG